MSPRGGYAGRLGTSLRTGDVRGGIRLLLNDQPGRWGLLPDRFSNVHLMFTGCSADNSPYGPASPRACSPAPFPEPALAPGVPRRVRRPPRRHPRARRCLGALARGARAFPGRHARYRRRLDVPAGHGDPGAAFDVHAADVTELPRRVPVPIARTDGPRDLAGTVLFLPDSDVGGGVDPARQGRPFAEGLDALLEARGGHDAPRVDHEACGPVRRRPLPAGALLLRWSRWVGSSR